MAVDERGESEVMPDEFEAWYAQREWWKSGSHESLGMAWLMLAGAGVSPKVIEAAFNQVVATVRDEYGD